jgi:hypothetical protein
VAARGGPPQAHAAQDGAIAFKVCKFAFCSPPRPHLYTLDGGDDNSASSVAWLKAQGAYPVCYFSAGSFENWRPDAASFLPGDTGRALSGWPGEYWLNIRSPNVRTIMANVREGACG